MSKQLLTYQDFKKKADFYDNSSDDRFKKYEKVSEETYLRDLIGADLVTAIKAGTYDELLPYVEDCLARDIEIYFLETANVINTGLGSVQRDSNYSKDPSFVDNQAKIRMVKTILRRYETVLREVLEAGDYTDYNDSTEITKIVSFSITSVGD